MSIFYEPHDGNLYQKRNFQFTKPALVAFTHAAAISATILSAGVYVDDLDPALLHKRQYAYQFTRLDYPDAAAKNYAALEAADLWKNAEGAADSPDGWFYHKRQYAYQFTTRSYPNAAAKNYLALQAAELWKDDLEPQAPYKNTYQRAIPPAGLAWPSAKQLLPSLLASELWKDDLDPALLHKRPYNRNPPASVAYTRAWLDGAFETAAGTYDDSPDGAFYTKRKYNRDPPAGWAYPLTAAKFFSGVTELWRDELDGWAFAKRGLPPYVAPPQPAAAEAWTHAYRISELLLSGGLYVDELESALLHKRRYNRNPPAGRAFSPAQRLNSALIAADLYDLSPDGAFYTKHQYRQTIPARRAWNGGYRQMAGLVAADAWRDDPESWLYTSATHWIVPGTSVFSPTLIPTIINLTLLQKQLNAMIDEVTNELPGYGTSLPTANLYHEGKMFTVTTTQFVYQIQAGAWVRIK